MRFDLLRLDLLTAMGLAAMAGCGEEGAPLPVDAAGPPLAVTLPPQLFAGAEVQVVVAGATPGAPVGLIGGLLPGAGPCPPALLGLCYDILNPAALGGAVASANGVAVIDVTLPHRLPPGTPILLQAAQAGAQPATSPPIPALVEVPPRVCDPAPWLSPATAHDYEVLACAPRSPGGRCTPAASLTAPQIYWMWRDNTGRTQPQMLMYPVCLETSIEDACCYDTYMEPPGGGRPFVIDGVSRSADLVTSAAWSAALDLDCSALAPEDRAALGHAWAETARAEHASIPAFARFVLQLLHLGAPADLVAEATRALADEVQHATDAFAIASAALGRPVGPGPIDATRALEVLDPAAILHDIMREGCVVETICAAQAAVARDRCEVPAIRAVLSRIAQDEQRHAALAWRAARWMLVRDPALVAVVHGALRSCPTPRADTAPALARYGVLPQPTLQSVARDVLEEVVRPCAQAMLAA